MGLIPGRVKNFLQRRTTAERADLTLLNLKEAKRWDDARAVAAEGEVVRQMKSAGFKLDSDDETLLAAAAHILTTGKLSEKDKLAAEAIAPQLFTLTTGDGEDPGFRRITSLATLRDLNPLMHDRMLQVCYFLRVTTPFGKRIVEILTDYTVGKGVRVTAKDERVQEVIDEFWNDDVNKMDENVEQWSDELTTFGELCVPVAINRVSGKVRAGYIDPMNIDTIQFAEMATADGTAAINIPYAVRLRRQVGEVLQKPMLIVRRQEDIAGDNYGKLDGECFYFSINKAKSASRGFSELFALADWVDLFDQMIFDFGDKVRFLNQFIWHYTFKGADEKRVDEYKNKLTKDPPRQGGALFTNENIEVAPLTPDFKGQDMAAGAGMVKKYGLGGAGIPPVLMGDGDDANRASALEMNAPFTKKIQKRQNHLSRCLKSALDFQIECAQIAGRLPENIDASYTIEFPEIVVKDLQKGASTLQGVSTSLQLGQQEGWITGSTAARAFHTVLAEIGVDIEDSNQEYEAAQQEKQDRAAQDQNDLFPQSKLNEVLNKLNGGPGKGPDANMLEDTEDRSLVN
jgi:hypothetical protein